MNAPEKSVWFVVPLVPPSGNHYKKPVRRGDFLGFYLTKEAKAFKEAVWVCAAHRWVDAKRFQVSVVVYLAKKQRGDFDNFWKLILDGLEDSKVIYSDAAVMKGTLEKRRDRANPRTEILIEAF